jgi:3-hydroxyacyl-CoA dehydrogenase/enoyl-CoA hydratase/3-hydroxybutyryl-CoA epimerase
LGKTPVVTSDSPGFLVNRVLFPYLGEAVVMVREGHDVRDLDRELRTFGMPMGPCELLDQVGLDVALHVAKSLAKTLSGVEPVIDQLSDMTGKGMLGMKSGQGFYRYVKDKRSEPTIVASPQRLTCDFDDFVSDGLSSIQRRLVYPMLSEAIRCHEEGVVYEPWAIDLAMVLGTGFAPHLGGPLHLVDAIGHPKFLQNLCRLRSLCGNRYAPPNSLFASADRGLSFFGAEKSEGNHQKIAN